MSSDNITQINDIITEYFNTHKVDYIPAKDIMPALISAGVFSKDHRKGLPFRKILRALDVKNELDKIPSVYADRQEKDTYWYLVREGKQFPAAEGSAPVSKKQLGISKRVNSDENYILNLCDELLNDTASRQHRFPFLLGDFHKDKKSRTKLPVDGYYENINLVIEYKTKQQTEKVSNSEERAPKTVSGVSRDEQQKIYTQRKREVLERKNVNLIEINYFAFDYDDELNIIRNKETDTKIVEDLLKDYLNS